MHSQWGPAVKSSILYVNPRYGGIDGLIILPLDQASAAAYAIAQGYEVEVLDLAFDRDDQRLRRKLESRTFDCVVMTAITICFRTAVEAARVIKEVRPDQPVAIMGEHVTFRRREVLERHACFDFVISFEAEVTSLELADALRQKRNGDTPDFTAIRGITFRAAAQSRRPDELPLWSGDKELFQTPDRPRIENLDIVPPPVKELYALSKYLDRDHETTMVTTRGCTHRCTFCHRWRYGRTLHNWSLPQVMKEIEHNLDNGFRSIFFQDDVFCYDKDRTRQFCETLVERNYGFEWNCNVRIDDFDPVNADHSELALLMRKAGCYRIFVGIEAFDQELLDRSRKGAQVKLIEAFVRFWQERGVQVHASYIVGLPGDSIPKVERRVELAIGLETDLASFNRIFPHPGTPYGDNPERFGIQVPDPYWYEKTKWWNSAVAGTKELAPEQVYELQQWALEHYTEASFVTN